MYREIKEIQRATQLEKIKDFLNFDDIGKVDKSDLHYIDKENLLEIELVANLLKKLNVKSNSELGKEIINLMLFYRKAYSFLRICSTAITYGGLYGSEKGEIKKYYDFLANSDLENILENYFNKKDYETLMKVIKG